MHRRANAKRDGYSPAVLHGCIRAFVYLCIVTDMEAILALEDGTFYRGSAAGAEGEARGEVVFNTSMTGYQEVLTDPSYAGQIVTMTCAEIGNYGVSPDDVGKAFATAYAGKPFVRLLGPGGCPDTKNVTGTNFIDIGWAFDERAGRLILLSAEDNLVKGAAGQAVQNLNLACGFDERAGLTVL